MYDTFSVATSTLKDSKKEVVESIRPCLTLQSWLFIMKNLAEALNFIHNKSIVHRDLKSDNVVFNKQGDTIQCVLVDFYQKVRKYQISEQEKEQYRNDHRHIAPDLVDGISDVSPASDMYSYGDLFKNIIHYFPPLCAHSICMPIINVIIKQCLKYNDSERPSAQNLVLLLSYLHYITHV